MKNKVKILNVEFDNLSLKEAVKVITEKKGFICTPNVDHLMKLQRDKEFYTIVKNADFVLCDSQIIVITSRILGTPIKERVAGSDFFPQFYLYNKRNKNLRIFLLGGDSQKVAEQAKSNINKKVGWEMVVDAYSPKFGFEKDLRETKLIIEKINDSKANVLVVGVGAPKQEKWIWKNKENLRNIEYFFPLGATINMEAGIIRKPPKWVSNIGLEWLYRCIQEPKRLVKRYFVDDIPYFYLILKQKLGLYQDPFNDEKIP